MRYAQFYHLSTGYIAGTVPPKFSDDCRRPIPAVGSCAVMYVDGRYNDRRAAYEARKTCRERGYIGFTMHAGPTLADSRETRPYEAVNKGVNK